MKVTLNWLRQYVDIDDSPAELTDRLTLLGLEVEGVEARGGGLEGVVVARVASRDPHPNADRLSVCRVEDGSGERQIVCGAQNFQAGDRVPLILPGATLPPKAPGEAPFTIKVGRIRGVESHGMLCAADELGLDPTAHGLAREDGLLRLPADAPVGRPLAEYLGLGGPDVVFDLEITPNRPDLNSLVGIAREISASTGHPLRLPSATVPESADAPAVEDLVEVRIEAPALCHRYTARVIRGLKVGPSPAWLRQALESVGMRSINNVVDATNYVMLETGQPLHAFDLHLLRPGASGRPGVVVREAAAGEVFVTLDGREHTLAGGELMIADAHRAIALAGVMGGRETEIQDTTVDVLLESAWFAPTSVRRTSRGLGLRTDASYRFERGADPGAVDLASRRCAALIVELAGGVLAQGVVDACPVPAEPRRVTLRHDRVNEVLGTRIAPEEIESHLVRLGLRAVGRRPRPVDAGSDAPPEPVTFEIPSFRVDLKQEIDLVEEVCRLHGVDRIPSTPPRGAVGSHPFDAVHDQLSEARRLLTGLGLDEAQGQTLVAGAGLDAGRRAVAVALANPLSADMDVLRPSLLPGLLDILAHNAARRVLDVRLFEVGRVFSRGDNGVREGWRVGLVLTGRRNPVFWSGPDRDADCDVADLKGVLEEFLEQFGVRGVQWRRREGDDGFHLESADILLGGRLALGTLGQLRPDLARRRNLRAPVLVAELDLDQLLARRNAGRSFKPLQAFPSVRRDAALLVPEAVTHDAVLAAVRQAKPENLESVELFDVFRGGQVPSGRKSLAYAFTYRAADRTLKEDEVNASHGRVLAACRDKLGAAFRE